jgi:hypothetical protein
MHQGLFRQPGGDQITFHGSTPRPPCNLSNSVQRIAAACNESLEPFSWLRLPSSIFPATNYLSISRQWTKRFQLIVGSNLSHWRGLAGGSYIPKNELTSLR